MTLVPPGPWMTVTVPPRMPILAADVVIVASPWWLNWPPTKRSAPWVSDTSMWPLLAFGS